MADDRKTDVVDWRHFERIVAALLKKLEPGATVEWNKRLPGSGSKKRRQIDVEIRGQLLGVAKLVTVDAKYYPNNTVDVKDVEEVAGLFGDVGADKGIIVTRRGFTDGALNRAQSLGILTCVLRPASDDDWEGYLRSTEIAVHLLTRELSDLEMRTAAGGEWMPVDRVDQVRDAQGKTSFVDRVVLSWLGTHTTWREGEPVTLQFTPPLVLLRDDVEPQCDQVRFRASVVDAGYGVTALIQAPQDWVFIKCGPDGESDEKEFFEFSELDAIAASFVRARTPKGAPRGRRQSKKGKS